MTRLGLRWQQLPLDQARRAAPSVRSLAQSFLDEVAPRGTCREGPGAAGVRGDQRAGLPDLGPAVVMDQLTVAVYEASRAGTQDGTGPAQGEGRELTNRLAGLRRRLADPVG
ncbi:MAG TPA: hypothetical protein VES01_00065 [Dermatophilaceae bacterium]|nr:hypothetical protein [Dermatophilaceae bacterium]